MQSPLFSFAERQTQERYALQNPQLLRITLRGNDDVLARQGSVVAHQGLVEFDGEIQTTMGQQHAPAGTGGGADLMRCQGQGTAYFAGLAQYVHVVDVDQDGLTVDSGSVLAMDAALHHEIVAVDSRYGVSGSGRHLIVVSGRGQVALMTSGHPLMVQVTPDRYVNADADAVVAWSNGLRVQMQAQNHSPGARRRGGNTGGAWELSFMGQGYALVQPGEPLPPVAATAGQGSGAQGQGPGTQYGMGPYGPESQNQGTVWN
ncbi:AIM24 family protein [Streptomyces sp. TS71-3]|uniref:AIM24 family protein n=1 Tax=Streptomyces sp. TS71-3 TaxID=2733862 RepID=UPI001B00EB23|nr:AIM24 family protein [Streptomyces sp. TS71-3]GHJ35844.1 hypothetical protein Sm713_14530 [Streptomyces sp. TS71-3]